MVFHCLLSLIKPSNEQLKRKTISNFTRLKIGLYQLLLKRLLKTYLHYAISDTILINNGSIKIVHELRDPGFESELARNKIWVKSELTRHLLPISIRKSKSKIPHSFFKFKNLLSLYIDGKELFIKHDDTLSIDGTIVGKIKSPSKNSCLFQSIIEILPSCNEIDSLVGMVYNQRTNTLNNNNPSSRRQKKSLPQNIFGREKDISSINQIKVLKNDKPEIICDNQPKSIVKKGFDIDTSF